MIKTTREKTKKLTLDTRTLRDLTIAETRTVAGGMRPRTEITYCGTGCI
jgi:hypothetical protein